MRSTILPLTAAVLMLAPISSATASDSGSKRTRPFVVHSDDPALRTWVPVRHVFPGKFSADLTPAQARALGRLGLRVTPVALYQPTRASRPCEPWPTCRNGGGDDGGSDGGRSARPSDPTPWGIELVYGDPSVTVTSGGAGVNVAILDTGVDVDHPDLVGRLAACLDFTTSAPRRRVKRNACQDELGHGTHVAGTVLADGGSDGQGLYGLAPQANLLAYKVCTPQGCWTDDISAAIDHAGAHGAHIVSMSLGASAPSALIADAIARNPHLLYVAAAGNDGPELGSIDHPGALAEVVAVGALDALLRVPSWSSRGVNDGDFVIEVQEVELAAPGVAIESTWHDGGYALLSGTSMATPHVSGLAALLWQGDAVTTRARLRAHAADVWDPGDDPATGLGLPSR